MGLLFDARYDRSLVTFLYWLLTWTADNKDEERQEPRSHRAFLITDGFLREVNVTFESVANAHFNCSNVSAAGFSNERVYTHYSIKNHYFTANLVIPYINGLINRFTLKSVQLIPYMKLISLLLLHNWTTRVVLPMIWRCLSGWCFCCVSRWPNESAVWRPSLKCWWVVKVSWRESQIWRTLKRMKRKLRRFLSTYHRTDQCYVLRI